MSAALVLAIQLLDVVTLERGRRWGQVVSELEGILRSGDGRAVVDALVQTTPSIAVIADTEGKILRVSRYACELSGLDPEELEGLSIEAFYALTDPRDRNGRRLEVAQSPLGHALKGRLELGREGSFRDSQGGRIPIVSNAAPFRSATGKVIGAITSVTDLRAFKTLEAELRDTAAEKELLFRELAHRVKNHLQVVTGLMALETRDAAPAVQEWAARMSARLQMLAAIYDSMNRTEARGRVDARDLIEKVVSPYASDTIEVVVSTPAEATLAADHAGPFGMLVNEAVCNSHKHAFPAGRGQIAIDLRQVGPDRIELEVSDNGVGHAKRSPGEASHGIRLMRLLARQLGGEMSLSERAQGGTTVLVKAPVTLVKFAVFATYGLSLAF